MGDASRCFDDIYFGIYFGKLAAGNIHLQFGRNIVGDAVWLGNDSNDSLRVPCVIQLNEGRVDLQLGRLLGTGQRPGEEQGSDQQ